MAFRVLRSPKTLPARISLRRLLCVSVGLRKRICCLRVKTVGRGESLILGMVILRSFSAEEENRIEAWKGTMGGEGPGVREDDDVGISLRCFEGPVEDPFGSMTW